MDHHIGLLALAVEGWRTWRDYRAAFATARDSVTNLARATAQHAEDTIRQVDVVTAALSERVEGDGLQTERYDADLWQSSLEVGYRLDVGRIGATALMDMWLWLLSRLGMPGTGFAMVGRWVTKCLAG